MKIRDGNVKAKLDKWFDDFYEGEPWWDDSIPMDDNEVFWKGFREWLNRRYDYVMRELEWAVLKTIARTRDINMDYMNGGCRRYFRF